LISLTFVDKIKLSKIFNLTIDGFFEKTNIIDFFYFLSLHHPKETWDFYNSYYNRIGSLFPNQISSILSSISKNFATLELSNSFKKFLVDNLVSLTPQLSISLEIVDNNVRWTSNRYPEVLLWLSFWDSKRNSKKFSNSIYFN
jgi:hypothetical protein